MTKKIVAVFGWRWEPEWLVEEALENLAPICDDVIVLDNRAQAGPWQDEGEYRRRQRHAAKKAGADWFLLTSPDERWEAGSAEVVREVVEHGPHAPRAVNIRELWTPTAYRVDGQFKYRPRYRLFPLEMMYGNVKHRRIHSRIINKAARKMRGPHLHTGVNVYHLKNALEGNRQRRVKVMKQLDTEIGNPRHHKWDDFLDEDVVLEGLPEGAFTPPFTRVFEWDPGVGR